MNLDNTAAKRRILFHFCNIVQQEQKLAITCPGNHSKLLAAFKIRH